MLLSATQLSPESGIAHSLSLHWYAPHRHAVDFLVDEWGKPEGPPCMPDRRIVADGVARFLAKLIDSASPLTNARSPVSTFFCPEAVHQLPPTLLQPSCQPWLFTRLRLGLIPSPLHPPRCILCKCPKTASLASMNRSTQFAAHVASFLSSVLLLIAPGTHFFQQISVRLWMAGDFVLMRQLLAFSGGKDCTRRQTRGLGAQKAVTS